MDAVSYISGATWARRGLGLALAAAAALVLLTVGAKPAAAFNVADFNFQNSNLQASGHSDTTISLRRQGTESEDLKDIRLDLPAGVFANPTAATACSAAQFQSDACPANSNVGSVQVVATALGLLDLTVNGTVDVLTSDAGQTATMGLTLRPDKICILFIFCAAPNKMYLKTGVTVKTYEDSALRTYTPGSPRSSVIGIPLVVFTPTIAADITIKSMKLSFQSRSGSATTRRVCGGFLNLSCRNETTPPSGPFFWLQTGSCETATASVELVSYQGATSSATSSFTPTGCPNVPFNPSMTIDPASHDGGAPTPLSFVLKIPEEDAPIQNSLPRVVDMDLPAGSGLNLDALSGVVGCTENQLKASNCPASSEIGTAYSFSKYIPGQTPTTPGLTGKVFAMGVGNQFPIGVEVRDWRNATTIIFRGTMGTRGDANEGTGRVYATFDKVPQVPYGELGLTIDKPVYKNPTTCGPATASATLTGFSGAVVSRSAGYTVVNCAAAPNTIITDGPPTTTSDRTPTFAFESSIAGSAFQCKVDDGAFTPCTSPYTSEALSAGPHTFHAKAINGPTEDATPASYEFTVSTSGFTVTPQIDVSTNQAVAHPDVSADFAISGGQPRSVTLRLPDGFAASLSARPLCSIGDAQAGTCSVASSIGVASVTVETFGGASETGTGNVYLTDAPTASDAAGVSANVRFSFGDLISVGGAYLVNNGKNQYLELRNIPQQVGTTQINVQNLTVDMEGSVNKFLTNPSDCSVTSSWRSTGVDYDGVEAEIFDIPFQATGCASVPFDPQITQVLTDPTAGAQTGVTAHMSLGVDNSAIKVMRVSEPPTLAPNFPAFGEGADQCPASAAPSALSVFDPTVCPVQAKVGSMTINTPLLTHPLVGDVFLIDKAPIPWLGVSFDDPGISVRFTGVTSTPQVDPECQPLFDPLGFCQTQISILFNNVPDVQVSSIDFVLDGPTRTGVNGALSGKMLRVATTNDPSCVPSSPAKSLFGAFSGGPLVNRSQDIAISGCA